MAKKNEHILIIVESPAKSKTIKKILGSSYDIEASYGHIRDFPPKVLGFDVQNNFTPSFEVIPEKKAVVKKLSDLAKKADKVYLASDPDREGEAIAWHVNEVIDVPAKKVFRIEFNEITPKAVTYAVEHPRQIDMSRVKAQQTRQTCRL
jgi:DNA topoisomerase-1